MEQFLDDFICDLTCEEFYDPYADREEWLESTVDLNEWSDW